MTWRKVLSCAVILSVLGTACSNPFSDDGDDRSGQEMRPRGPQRGGDERDPPDDDRDPTEVVEAALAEVEAFWTEEFPDVFGDDYEPVSRFVEYGPDTPEDEFPVCGPGGDTYEDLANNAIYCPLNDTIAWDLEGLIEPLQEDFGSFTVAIVMAHEFGHAVQARSGDADRARRTIELELQADCLAGAWVAHVEAGDSDDFAVTVDELDVPVAGLVEIFGDRIGITADVLGAHGTGFDRVFSFQEGFEQGAERCAEYLDDFPDVVQVDFRSEGDEDRGGNLDPDALIDLVDPDVDLFIEDEVAPGWDEIDVVRFDPRREEPGCDPDDDGAFQAYYCEEDDTIYLDEDELLPALDDIGDFALAAEIVRQHAVAFQVIEDLDGSDDELELHADCLVGAYAQDRFELRSGADRNDVVLSPEDLDEALIAIAQLPAVESGNSVFERIDAVFEGFSRGADRCDSFLG